jgi:autotransporter-associated beta strand protein
MKKHLLLLSLALPSLVFGQVTWNGSSTGAWGTAGNWTGTAPVNNGTSSLVFRPTALTGAAVTSMNNGLTNFTASAISLDQASTAGTTFTLAGNSFILGGDITSSNAAATSVTHQISAPIQISNARTISLVDRVNLHLSGVISVTSGTHGLTKTGAGNLTLSATNTYGGLTDVQGGVLQLNSVNALPGGIGTSGGLGRLHLQTGGVLGLGANDFTRGLGNNAGELRLQNYGGFAAFGGNRAVNIGGSGASVSWGSTNFGATTALILSHSTATHTLTFQNPTDLNGSTRTVEVPNGSATVDAVISGAIGQSSGSHGFTKTGTGTLQLTAANTYTGTTTVSAGNLQLGNGNGTGSLSISATSISVSSGATLSTNRTGTLNLNQTISGAGDLVVQNPSGGITLLSSGSNSYTGTTTVSSGLLRVGNSGTGRTGTGALTVASGASILGTGTIQASSALLSSGANLHVGDGTSLSTIGTLTFAPNAGSGSINFASGSILNLGMAAGSGQNADLLNITGTGSNTLSFQSDLIFGPSTFSPSAAETFNLLDWSGLSSAPTFASHFNYAGLLVGNGDEASGLNLPDLTGSSYRWDISQFVTNGSISLVSIVPEPSRASLLLLGLLTLTFRRKRSF